VGDGGYADSSTPHPTPPHAHHRQRRPSITAPSSCERGSGCSCSACRTAFTGATDLIDESIHLASAFQVAGFRHVVGTLWEVDDAIAARVAATFYSALQTASGLSTNNTAQALHHAVRRVRDGDYLTGSNDLTHVPSLWAAYIHAGA
jgi:CHAT domain-containing protein